MHTEELMARGSVDYLKKGVMIADAWETLRPNLVLSRMTVHQFKAAVMPSFTKRVEIEQARATLQRLMSERDSVDRNTSIMMMRVVNAVKGEPGEDGDDGELYAAMGYLTFSQRREKLLQAMGEQRR